MIRLKYTILCLFFVVPTIFGQYLNTVKYSKDDLQIYSGIVGMHEDKQGYIWVYGFGGISRYDGFTFEPIDKIYPNSENLISKNCSSLFKDDNFLWVGTSENGLTSIDKKGEVLTFNQFVKDPDTLASRNIKQVISDENKLFVLGEYGLEAFRLENRNFQKIELPNIDSKTVDKIFLHKSFLWVENQDGLHKIDLVTLEYVQFGYLKNTSFFTHPNGGLWIASISEGTIIYRFEESSSKFIAPSFQPYENYKKTRGYTWLDSSRLISTPLLDLFLEIADFERKQIEHIDTEFSNLDQERFLRTPFTDGKGRTWIFGQDAYLIPKKTIIDQHFISKETDVINDLVVKDGFTYLSVRNKGLYIYGPKGQLVNSYTTQNSPIADNNISSIVELENGRLGLCMMDHFQILSEDIGFEEAYKLKGIIRSAIEDDRYLYIGGYSGIFKVNKSTRSISNIDLPISNPKAGNPINTMLSLNADYLKFASTSTGVLTLETDQNELDLMNLLLAQLRSSKSKNRINHAAISPTGLSIISATDNGLYLITNKPIADSDTNGKISQRLKKMFLENDTIKIETADRFFTNVVFFNDTIAYASSRKQIYRINLSKMAVETYGRLQGTVNNSFTLRSNFKDAEGNIYFGGDQGVDKVTEAQYQPTDYDNEVIIEQIYHNGILQFPAQKQKHRIPSDTKIAEFKVNMPENQHADQVLVQGRVDDNEWTNLSVDHKMTLYNPPTGAHTISFRALDLSGQDRSAITQMDINVLKKWYEYLWIWVLLALLIVSALLVSLFSWQKVQNERAMNELRLQEELASLKLTSLNSQMNPHFIFNALSSIQQLITNGETDIAEDYLSKFSKLLRHVIQYASYKNVRLTAELDFIKNYLDLELLRFEDAFAYEIENLVPDLENVFIPPFFIQPQVENAIKHGFSDENSNYLIKIKLEESKGTIKITIEDNGQGRKAAQNSRLNKKVGTRKGNILTEQRIVNLNNLNYKSTYKVEDLYTNGKASGTRVTMEFNLEKLAVE